MRMPSPPSLHTNMEEEADTPSPTLRRMRRKRRRWRSDGVGGEKEVSPNVSRRNREKGIAKVMFAMLFNIFFDVTIKFIIGSTPSSS